MGAAWAGLRCHANFSDDQFPKLDMQAAGHRFILNTAERRASSSIEAMYPLLSDNFQGVVTKSLRLSTLMHSPSLLSGSLACSPRSATEQQRQQKGQAPVR